MTFEHQADDEGWTTVAGEGELADRLFMLGGRGRITIDTRSGPYVLEGDYA